MKTHTQRLSSYWLIHVKTLPWRMFFFPLLPLAKSESSPIFNYHQYFVSLPKSKACWGGLCVDFDTQPKRWALIILSPLQESWHRIVLFPKYSTSQPLFMTRQTKRLDNLFGILADLHQLPPGTLRTEGSVFLVQITLPCTPVPLSIYKWLIVQIQKHPLVLGNRSS